MAADKTLAALEAIVAAGFHNQQSAESGTDEPTDAQLAQWWLDYGVDRKLLKRNTMVFAYGSKVRGFADQLLEDHMNPWVKANGEPPYKSMTHTTKMSRLLKMVSLPMLSWHKCS